MVRPRIGNHVGAISLFALTMCLTGIRGRADADRIPVPDESAQQRSMELVKDLYRDKFLGAKSGTEKTALAQLMLNDAADIKSDPAGAYVLFRVGRDIAVGANNLAVALDAIDRMSGRFEMDPLPMKLNAAIAVAKSATSSNDRKAAAKLSIPLVRSGLAADQYRRAAELAKLAESAARRAREFELARNLADLSEKAFGLAEGYRQVEEALTALKLQPDDPDANQTVGQFTCLVKGDWPNGLTYLALSSNETLRALATADLSGADQWMDQVKIADGWWGFAQDKDELTKTNALRRSAHWYQRARPMAVGLRKTQIEKRLEGIDAVVGEQPLVAGDGSNANYSFKAVKSKLLGNNRHTPFEETAPDGAVLVGFRVSVDNAFGGAIGAVQPVYRKGRKTMTGRVYGRGKSGPIDLIAKPDYAVGELKARTGLLIDGFRLVFMRIDSKGLNPNDRYESPWAGGNGGGEKTVSASGNQITGVYGSVGNRLEGLGIIVRQRVLDGPAAKGGWTVIFRSSNPAIWNTDFVGDDQVAMTIDRAPDDIRFLRLTLINKSPQHAIIPMRKDQLLRDWQQGKYAWNGRNNRSFGGHHLGIYLNQRVDVHGQVHVGSHHAGWGFGHIHHGGDLPGGYTQGYTWAGKRLQPSVIEIAVKKDDLDRSDTRHLLR